MIHNRAVTPAATCKLTRQAGLFLFALLCGTVFSGCATARSMMSIRQQDPMAGAPRLRNVKSPSLDEIVAHHNRNTDKIESWQAGKVSIHLKGINVPLHGRLAVERSHRVRLEVTSPRGVEADIGSNDQRFWVWSRDMGPSIITCKHENTEIVRQSEGIPFEPDWLMEVLSASPIPTTGVTLEMSPAGDLARLERHITTARGKPLRREVMVDLRNGGVVSEHSLYDFHGNRIALARLSSYVHDKVSGAFLPHRIAIDWPQEHMTITMDLGKVNINPKSIPSEVWAMPQRPGSELVELDKHVRQIAIGQRSANGDAIDDSTNQDDAPEADDDEMELPFPASDRTGRARITNNSDEPVEDELPESTQDDLANSRTARFSDAELAE